MTPEQLWNFTLSVAGLDGIVLLIVLGQAIILLQRKIDGFDKAEIDKVVDSIEERAKTASYGLDHFDGLGRRIDLSLAKETQGPKPPKTLGCIPCAKDPFKEKRFSNPPWADSAISKRSHHKKPAKTKKTHK
jgi:hypothetical protein